MVPNLWSFYSCRPLSCVSSIPRKVQKIRSDNNRWLWWRSSRCWSCGLGFGGFTREDSWIWSREQRREWRCCLEERQLVKILFWKRVLLLLLDYHGKLYFKLVEIIIRNANPSQTRNKTATISNSLRDSSSQSSIIPQIPTQKKERKEKSTTNRKRARANLPIASKNFVPVNTIIATFKAIRRRTANRSSLPCHGVAIIAYLRMRKRGRPKKNPRPNPN